MERNLKGCTQLYLQVSRILFRVLLTMYLGRCSWKVVLTCTYWNVIKKKICCLTSAFLCDFRSHFLTELFKYCIMSLISFIILWKNKLEGNNLFRRNAYCWKQIWRCCLQRVTSALRFLSSFESIAPVFIEQPVIDIRVYTA